MPTPRRDEDHGGPRDVGPDRVTSAQLRADIDRGATGDKVGGFDPAAAPLGADEEAAGTPVSPAMVAHARDQERAGAQSSRHANAATPELAPDGRLKARRGWLGPAAAGILVAAALGLMLWFLLAG